MSELTPISELVPAELARTWAAFLAQSDDAADRCLGEEYLKLEAELRALKSLQLEPLFVLYRRADEHVRFLDDESFSALADAVRDAAATVPPETA